MQRVKMQHVKRILIVLPAVLLAACGGGAVVPVSNGAKTFFNPSTAAKQAACEQGIKDKRAGVSGTDSFAKNVLVVNGKIGDGVIALSAQAIAYIVCYENGAYNADIVNNSLTGIQIHSPVPVDMANWKASFVLTDGSGKDFGRFEAADARYNQYIDSYIFFLTEVNKAEVAKATAAFVEINRGKGVERFLLP